MHLRVVQRGRHTIGPDEMFFRNEKTRARTGLPLKGFPEVLGSAIELRCDLGLGGRFPPKPRRRDKSIAKLDSAPPNGDSGNEQENRRSDKHRAIVIRLKPVHRNCQIVES